MGRAGVIVLLWACVLSPSMAHADDTPRPAHQGVMLRLALGAGYAHGWSRAADQSRTTSALAGVFSLSLGHTVTDSLVVHMDVLATRSGSATASAEGTTVARNVALTATLVGAGATYWFAPNDFFITGGLGIGHVSTVAGTVRIGIDVPDLESTDPGVGFHLGAGKQWRIAPKWGLGPALQFWFLSAPQRFDATRLKFMCLTLSATVTYD